MYLKWKGTGPLLCKIRGRGSLSTSRNSQSETVDGWMNEENKTRCLCVCEKGMIRQKEKRMAHTQTTNEILSPNDIPPVQSLSFYSDNLYPSIHPFPGCVVGDTNRMFRRNIFMSRWAKGASEVKYIVRIRWLVSRLSQQETSDDDICTRPPPLLLLLLLNQAPRLIVVGRTFHSHPGQSCNNHDDDDELLVLVVLNHVFWLFALLEQASYMFDVMTLCGLDSYFLPVSSLFSLSYTHRQRRPSFLSTSSLFLLLRAVGLVGWFFVLFLFK